MAKYTAESGRPTYFSKKRVDKPEQRGDSGKGPLAKNCCGESRSVKLGGKSGRPKGV